MKCVAYLLLAMFFTFDVFANFASPSLPQEVAEFYSFENDLEGWNINGTDLELGSGFIDWSITRSQERAKDGSTSLEFFLANNNDAGKIWVEKPFAVEPNQLYQVSVEYQLATSDFGTLTLFSIITGAMNKQPHTRTDLVPAYKDVTGNGSETNVGYNWLKKEYEFSVRTNEEGTIYVVVGIWGTFETDRTYYFDNIRVSITGKPAGSNFYSFENGLEGWEANATDLEPGGGSLDWSVARVRGIWEDGAASVEFGLNNPNNMGKVWIERPFAVEPRKKYKVNIDYAFHSDDCGDTPRFRIITGVFRKRPETGDDLVSAFQEKTTSTRCTWGWLHKSYEFKVKTKKSDALYVVIGIWGTEQAWRRYNFDSVCITLTEKK